MFSTGDKPLHTATYRHVAVMVEQIEATALVLDRTDLIAINMVSFHFNRTQLLAYRNMANMYDSFIKIFIVRCDFLNVLLIYRNGIGSIIYSCRDSMHMMAHASSLWATLSLNTYILIDIIWRERNEMKNNTGMGHNERHRK